MHSIDLAFAAPYSITPGDYEFGSDNRLHLVKQMEKPEPNSQPYEDWKPQPIK